MTWEYIAGFFDGEGSVAHNGKGFRVSISQTNLEVLADIHMFTGLGHICNVKKRKSHWKESWVYYIAKQRDVHDFLIKIFPFVVVKKALIASTCKKLNITLVRREKILQKTEKRKEMAWKLRKQGLSYRRIGKAVGVDWGYARRMLIRMDGARSSIG